MGEVWTVLKILKWTAGYLGERGVDNPRLDAEVLLSESLQLDRVGLYLNYDRPLTRRELDSFRERVGRRARREPVAYILGKAEFWSLPFVVSPAVLIPRPDTEILVEEVLKRIEGNCSILDAGTGSGAIAVALAHELPGAQVEGVDISPEALEVARENARLNEVDERVRFLEADLAELPGGPYDLIVSNPPYIPEEDMAELMPEVQGHEPRLALCGGGEDGLDCYRHLAAQAPRLAPGGWLLVEVGIGQARQVKEMLDEAGFAETFVRSDYGGVERVVGGRTVAGMKQCGANRSNQ